MPYDVLELMDRMMELGDSEDEKKQQESLERNLKYFKEMMNTIYSYGSEKAIEIVALMQKENYSANGNIANLDNYRIRFISDANQIRCNRNFCKS